MAGFAAGFSANVTGGISASAGISVSTGSSSPNQRPFVAFNFLVDISVDGVSGQVCGGAFSECDGLEMSIEPKTIREGGRNNGPVHLMGHVTYAQLTLRRGMTPNFDLWNWFEKVTSRDGGGVRATAEVTMLSSDGSTEQARFVLTGCLPVRLKASPLNAKDGQLAIEEMQISFENLSLKPPGGGGLGISVGLASGGAVGVSATASASLDVSGGFSAGAAGGFSIG
jgi:phage tail-like protein